jgi:hypothetical protein
VDLQPEHAAMIGLALVGGLAGAVLGCERRNGQTSTSTGRSTAGATTQAHQESLEDVAAGKTVRRLPGQR